MTYDILLRGNYATLQVLLKNGEEIKTESGAMLAMESSATIEGKMDGGLWKAIKRSVLTSESFFVTTIRANENDTEVLLAPRATGDIEVIELSGAAWIVQGGGFLACEKNIDTDSHFAGFKGFLSGEGLFMIRAEGTGNMFVSSFGGIIKKDLKAGQKYIVDNGHIVAFPADMNYEIGQAGKGMMTMVTTGEGLVTEFTGPGTVYLQTRNLRTFAETLNPFMPNRQNTQDGGLLGNLFGG